MKRIIIAIDGTSSTGKSSIARQLAERVGYTYIDTGAMYRAVTLLAMQGGAFSDDGRIDEARLQGLLEKATIQFRANPRTGRAETFLNDENVEQEIRSMQVSSHVSPIAALPFVRKALVTQQQKMGHGGGIVMDGRDIGTTVFPQAEMKIFMTASPEVRARRRFLELQEKGMDTPYEEVLKNVQERDHIDTHRATSPLRKADDALLLDNSNMTMEEEMDVLLRIFQEKTAE
ncbi:MAG: (d)CMP kinase [Bacteroidaceae bacterium]|nr:(d)CMP kinase [Bacteroidaceae bacterium]